MREVLTRHLIRAKEADDLPDLIIVDGGKGQLNVALDVFKELDIATVDVIALAKEEGSTRQRNDSGKGLPAGQPRPHPPQSQLQPPLPSAKGKRRGPPQSDRLS